MGTGREDLDSTVFEIQVENDFGVLKLFVTVDAGGGQTVIFSVRHISISILTHRHRQATVTMWLHHPLDGITNLKYKLYFLTPNKKIKEKLAFNRDRCCHLALCLWLILFHCTCAGHLGQGTLTKREGSIQLTFLY